MKTLIKWASLVPVAAFFGVLLLSGCGGDAPDLPDSPGLPVGQKLYMSDGSQYGTVVAVEEAHRFENGVVEPAALVDFSPRIPGQQSWLPLRSAQKMVR